MAVSRIPRQFFQPSVNLALSFFRASIESGANTVDRDQTPPFRHRLDVTPDWFPADFDSEPSDEHTIEGFRIRLFRYFSTVSRRALNNKIDAIWLSKPERLEDAFVRALCIRLHIRNPDDARELLHTSLRTEMQAWLSDCEHLQYQGPRWRVSLREENKILLIPSHSSKGGER